MKKKTAQNIWKEAFESAYNKFNYNKAEILKSLNRKQLRAWLDWHPDFNIGYKINSFKKWTIYLN